MSDASNKAICFVCKQSKSNAGMQTYGHSYNDNTELNLCRECFLDNEIPKLN